MATFNTIYHHSIIHFTCNKNNSSIFCPNSASKKRLTVPRKKLHVFAAISENVEQVSTMASGFGGTIVKEVLPSALDSSSDPPAIFDGEPKLYISYTCPYAQRVWITRNCKGLQKTIKLVPINLKSRPAWYKEKVYPANKVPALEHNNEVKGESLDLIQYIDSNFKGPSLFPDDPTKKMFGEELLSFVGTFYKAVITSLKENRMNDAGAAFDQIETALSKFNDGPFFLGQFSLVDIAYVPFIERFQPFFSEVKELRHHKRQEMNKIDAYKQTKRDQKEHVESYKKRFLVQEMNKIDAYKQTKRDQKEHVESYKKRFLVQSST